MEENKVVVAETETAAPAPKADAPQGQRRDNRRPAVEVVHVKT